MITLINPAFVRELNRYPGGLFPVPNSCGQSNTLVVKCSKEMILTARILRQIRFYLIPLDADGVSTCGLVTAFFDDPDEPLTIRTPLLDDGMGNDILDLLCARTFDIHFFDEYNREFLGYRARNRIARSFVSSRSNIRLASPTYIPSPKIDDQILSCFSTRNPEDDNNALVVDLVDELFPSDFIIWDARPENNSYQGRKHDMFTALERENSGLFSELDIVKSLQRVFSNDQIFLNPLRTDNGREFVDVMVVTPTNLLLIQAKDSPNKEETLRQPIKRKMSTVLRHLNKATNQLRGSISYMHSNDPFSVQCGDTSHTIVASDLNVVSFVIVKELFLTEYKSYSQPIFKVFYDTGVPCIIQDYSQFHCLTFHRGTNDSFFDTLAGIMKFALSHKEFPRTRFWL